MSFAARQRRTDRAAPAALRTCLSFWLALLLAWVVFVAPVTAADRIAVNSAQLQLADDPEGALVLDAQFDFELPPVLEDAVNRGVALFFVVEFELFRPRWYWFDKKLVDAVRTYRLTYSPLTRQYRLATGALAQPFDSLADALATLRRVRGWRVADRTLIRPDDDYTAQVRMRLDTSQLPKPFQVNALTNRDWTLASDWRNVPVSADLAK
ncbi:MAG TPA: DUF4390 domain-containing protein [Burkholderiaceae bacterium]|nr:DUF4390 domain-containing protein [Burkholderiaceae bacterium]